MPLIVRDTETFIKKARTIHGDKYNYSPTLYTKNNQKLEIACPDHGSFWQIADYHVNGKNGCPACSSNKKVTFETFLERVKDVHGDVYDYSLAKSQYKTVTSKISIICKEHGKFLQSPFRHMEGQRCPECSKIKVQEKYNLKRQVACKENFIAKAKKVYEDLYDYSNTKYVSAKTKIEAVCPLHGSFSVLPHDHLRGHGCSRCGQERSTLSRTKSREQFLLDCRKVHGEVYEYTPTNYQRDSSKVKIVCGKHGEFSQTPRSHLNGNGCPKCVHTYSKPHKQVVEYLRSLGFEEGKDFTVNDRKTLLNPVSNCYLELDVYFANINKAVEVDGHYYHSAEDTIARDRIKDQLCEELAIKLLRVSDKRIRRDWLGVQEDLRCLLL